MNSEGELVTSAGYRVNGEGGAITLPEGEISISSQGSVMANGEEVDMLKLVEFEDVNALGKVGEGLYKARSGAAEAAASNTKVCQGFLEESNVKAIQEMVNMITLEKLYQANAKALMAQDSTLDKTVNQVGTLR